jgi:hypothetical protein
MHFGRGDKLIKKIQDCLFRELQSQGRRVVLCEKEKLLLSGNRLDAIIFSLRSHLENARGIADTFFSVTFDFPNFPTVSKMKFSKTWLLARQKHLAAIRGISPPTSITGRRGRHLKQK